VKSKAVFEGIRESWKGVKSPTPRYPRSRTKPRAQSAPLTPPTAAPPTPDERQPCQPEAHGRSHGCPACESWEHGMVLLRDGTTRAKARWVQAHGAPPEEEETAP